MNVLLLCFCSLLLLFYRVTLYDTYLYDVAAMIYVMGALNKHLYLYLYLYLYPLAEYCGCSCTHWLNIVDAAAPTAPMVPTPMVRLKTNDVIIRLWGFMVPSFARLNPIFDVRIGRIQLHVVIYSRLSRL